MNLMVSPATPILQPPQTRATHSPSPPPWNRAEMLPARWTQASGIVLERLILAASMQPALWSSCKCPVAPGSTDLSPGNPFTCGRSTTY